MAKSRQTSTTAVTATPEKPKPQTKKRPRAARRGKRRSSLDYGLVTRIYREAFPVMALTTFAEIGAGALLSDLRDFYRLLPGILIIVPGLMELRGNIATSLAQRLGSALHMGVISWELGLNPELKQNLRASIFLSITVAIVLGLAGWLILRLIGEETIGPLQIIFVTLGVASLAGFLQAFLTTGVAMYAAHRGLDPDNVTIPILATIGDILTVAFLLLVVRLLLLIQG